MRNFVEEWSVVWIAIGTFDILNGLWPLQHPVFVGACLIVTAVVGRAALIFFPFK